MKFALSLILIISISISGLNAQELDEVFDDGLSSSDNSFFLGANYLAEGVLTIGYEHSFMDGRAYSVWAGIVLFEGIPTHAYLGDEMINYYSNSDSLTSGFLIGVNYKRYAYDNAGLFGGYELGFEMRRGDTYGRNSYKFLYIIGYKWQLFNSLGISISSGVGIQIFNRYKINETEPINPYDSYSGLGALIPLKIDFVYYF
ncbi:MAG: hypothetical protein DRI84_01505 [Bacteroidetes bacterium]|nr:MAG: hypothetical protein DRI84_01505 [Bacteroidota bacterium]